MKVCNQYNINFTEIISFDSICLFENSLLLKDGLANIRKNHLNFHAKNNDYFGTLATVLSMLNQDADNLTKKQKSLLRNICTDLEYMQTSFQISSRKKRS